MRHLIALSLVAALAVPAHAAPAAPSSRVIKTRDLDLRTERGVERLRTRVAMTATRVCQKDFYGYDRATPDNRHIRSCRAQAIERVEPRLMALVSRARGVGVAATSGGNGAADAGVLTLD